jgi:hypothetical protein
MSRWLFVICAAGLLQACGTFGGTVAGDPGREVFGVVAHQPDASDGATPASEATPTDAADKKLDWEASQICTLGSMRVSEDVEPGDGGKQLVDRLVRCRPYGLSAFGVSFVGIVPPAHRFWPF